ncbi:hypothetical protein SAMN05446635_5582 [Burkholderia sp. OK233]|nr:hypothetical protein SAMN05446635_5582 [Burkholderia sp. OK233]
MNFTEKPGRQYWEHWASGPGSRGWLWFPDTPRTHFRKAARRCIVCEAHSKLAHVHRAAALVQQAAVEIPSRLQCGSGRRQSSRHRHRSRDGSVRRSFRGRPDDAALTRVSARPKRGSRNRSVPLGSGARPYRPPRLTPRNSHVCVPRRAAHEVRRNPAPRHAALTAVAPRCAIDGTGQVPRSSRGRLLRYGTSRNRASSCVPGTATACEAACRMRAQRPASVTRPPMSLTSRWSQHAVDGSWPPLTNALCFTPVSCASSGHSASSTAHASGHPRHSTEARACTSSRGAGDIPARPGAGPNWPQTDRTSRPRSG